MNHDAIKNLSGIDRHRFEKAHHKKAGELTLDDCMIIGRCGEIFKDDPDLELWIYGGEKFDLQIWGEHPDNFDGIDDQSNEITPETVKIVAYNVDRNGKTDYNETVQEWTIDYNQTNQWR